MHLLGTHDFSCFCAANTSVVDKVRTVHAIELTWHGEELHMFRLLEQAFYIIWYVLLLVHYGKSGQGSVEALHVVQDNYFE